MAKCEAVLQPHEVRHGQQVGCGDAVDQEGLIGHAVAVVVDLDLSRAGSYTTEAIEGLVTLMRDASQPGAVRLGAMRELLDRGHGRPAQAVAGADGTGPIVVSWVTGDEERG